MPEKNIKISVGGSVEKAMKGEYTIDVKAVLSEAWRNTLKSRMSINIALVGIVIFGMIVTNIASSFFGGIESVFDKPELLQWLILFVSIVIWPFIAGIEMMGVMHAVNQPTKSSLVFSFLHRGSWVALCILLTSLLGSIAFELATPLGEVLPVFFSSILSVLFSFTILLVVEKKLNPLQAIVLSIKSLRFKFFSLLATYVSLFMVLLFLLLIASALTKSTLAPVGVVVFIFGLSYLAPWYYNIKGILYREIFGVTIVGKSSNNGLGERVKDVSDHKDSDDTFSA